RHARLDGRARRGVLGGRARGDGPVRVRALVGLGHRPLASRPRLLQRQWLHRGHPLSRRARGTPHVKTPRMDSRAALGEGPDKERFVSQMFSRIAPRYDLMNGLMTFGMHHAWRRAAARQTLAAPEGPALDLATGTGDLALELRRVHPGRLIVGAD